MQEVAGVPDTELALQYVELRQILAQAEPARHGATVVFRTPSFDLEVDQSSVEPFIAWNSQARAGLERVIRNRGFADLHGAYTGAALQVCKETPSPLAVLLLPRGQIPALPEEVELLPVVIEQDGPALIVRQRMLSRHTGAEDSIDHLGGVVGTAVAVRDARNPLIRFVGSASGPVVTLRPDHETIGHASSTEERRSMERCVVTLTRQG